MDTPASISTLCRKMHMSLNSQMEDLGLSNSQAMLVFCINEKGKITQSEICKTLDMDKSTVAKMLLRLEKDGMIQKEQNPEDTRSFLVSLTEKSLALLPAAKALQDAWLEKVTANLTDIERAIFYQLIQKVAVNATELCKVHEG